ncbi:DMT family transporter [Phaeovulum sp.]|uniref:DMT family transporter n=1 Tax=Phaeovulum sp. TaxID=2934796 RepID=UPI0035667FAF
MRNKPAARALDKHVVQGEKWRRNLRLFMPQTSRPLAAALWMLGAITGFVSMAIAGREVAPFHDTFEIMTYRSVIGLVIVLVAALVTGQMRHIRARNLGRHALRNAFHFTGQNLWFYALTIIPLAQLFAVEFSYPIMVALAAPFVLGERLTPVRVVAAGLGFLGVLIAADPWAAGGLSPGILIALGAAVGFAGSALVTKQLTRLAPMIEILFWLTVFQLIFGLVLAGYDGVIAPPSAASALWLLLIGIAGLGGHFCLTRALSLAPASVVAPIDFLRLPIIGIVGMMLYDEPLQAAVFFGGAVIFTATWLTIRSEGRARRALTGKV